MYDSTSTDQRVNNCQRDLRILLSKYMQQKYSLEDLKTYLQRSKHENLIEASQLLKDMLKQKDTEKTAKELQSKIDDLYNAITPLLNNLKKNPEKEYILWPDRLNKVEQFEDYLTSIYQK